MTNLSHIFPSGYLNIPTEEDLRFEVQDMLRYACTDKQIMDQLRSIRCPYLRKALGMLEQGNKEEFLVVQEGIWTILIDRREKCHKDPKDLFYPQTYLGLVGYLVEKEVINGKPQKILDCLYEKNDQSMMKNLKRSIVSAFPEGTREMLDFYIDLMKRQLLI